MLQTAGLATKIGFPTSTIKRWLEDLTALGVAEREKGSGPQGDKWRILPIYRDIILRFEGITPEGGELTGDNAEEGNLAPSDRKLIEEETKAEAQRRLDEAGF